MPSATLEMDLSKTKPIKGKAVRFERTMICWPTSRRLTGRKNGYRRCGLDGCSHVPGAQGNVEVRILTRATALEARIGHRALRAEVGQGTAASCRAPGMVFGFPRQFQLGQIPNRGSELQCGGRRDGLVNVARPFMCPHIPLETAPEVDIPTALVAGVCYPATPAPNRQRSEPFRERFLRSLAMSSAV